MIIWTSSRAVSNNHFQTCTVSLLLYHDDVIKWKHFPCCWPFVRGMHLWPVNSPHKGQWRGALIFPLICAWINSWVNNREAGDLRRHRAHYDVTVTESTPWHIVDQTRLTLCRWHFKCISSNENVLILNKIPLKYVPVYLFHNSIGWGNGLMPDYSGWHFWALQHRRTHC